ncbi:AAA family ATPase [Actinosynnema sp. NPDC051121]
MALVERHEELATLDRLYAECASGRGQVVVISGGVASGKTELVHEFAERGAARGAVLLSATSSRAESTLGFNVLGQLFRSPSLPAPVADHLGALLRDHDRARPAAADDDPMAIGDASAGLLDGVCTALLELARAQPLVICVDDVQFTDVLSLQALLYLQRRMRFAKVLMVLSKWVLPRPSQSEFRTELTRQPHTSHLRLSPLTRDGVAEMLAARFDEATVRALAPVHHAVSGGNPLLVKALIDDQLAALRSGAAPSGGDIAVGQEFALAVLTCLHRWDLSMLRIACGLALLGDAATPVMLGNLLDVPADFAAQMLDVMEMAGLLNGGRFRHPVARAAVLDSLTPAERAALDLAAASLLHADGAAAPEVAAHLVDADRFGGVVTGQWAVAVLRHAAGEDLSHGRIDGALAKLDLVVRTTSDDAERADVHAVLLQLEWSRNPAAVGKYLTPLRIALTEGRLSRHNTLQLAKFLLWYGCTKELSDALAELTSATGGADAGGELGLVVQWLSFLYPAAAPVPAPRRQERPRPAAYGPWTGALTMLDRLRSGGSAEEIAVSAEHVLQNSRFGDHTPGEQVAAVAAVTALLHTDRTEAAARWCEALLSDPAVGGLDVWGALFGALRAEVLFRQGDLLAAAEQAREAHELLPPRGWGVVVGVPLSVRVTAATAMGRHDEAAALLRTPVPDAVYDTQFGLHYLNSRGQYRLATGSPHAALNDFRRCGELMREWRMDLPSLVPWRIGAAKVHLLLGDRQGARALVVEHLGLRGADGPRTRGIALRVLASTAPQERRTRMLKESVELLRVARDRFELAHSLLDLSRAHKAEGDWEQARAMARRAGQMAKACRAEPLSRELSIGRGDEVAETRDAGSGDQDGLDALSEAERRVAALAGLGHTNREISEKLHITVSTVEQHLTRVYRKLNVTKRAELPASLPREVLSSAEKHWPLG